MTKLTKEEALKRIDELTKFVEDCDKKEYVPEVGETVICHGLQGEPYDYDNKDGDIAVVIRVDHKEERACLYNTRWHDDGKWYAHLSQIEPLDIDKIK